MDNYWHSGAAFYVPLMQKFFGTTALGLGDWAFLLSLAVVVVMAEEIRKLFVRRFSKTSRT
jgi:hypothetical protein